MEVFLSTLAVLVFVAAVVAISLIPFFVAYSRGHAYKWIILVLCLIPIVFTWFIALVWALWPQNRSLIDPIAGNPTGTGRANSGTTAQAVMREAHARDPIEELARLNELRHSGAITEAEFAQMKSRVLSGAA